MTKPVAQSSFEFLNEVEQVAPSPRKHALRPPAQIEVAETQSSLAEVAANGTVVELPAEPNPNKTEVKASTRGRKSVKESSAAAELIEMPDEQELLSKQYYSMGEVTTMLNESHSLIRYWEAEFDILKPKKNGKGDRFFRPVDVKNLYMIYDLLRRRKFTIEGAKDYLRNSKKADEKFVAVQSLQKIRSFLLELKAGL